MFTYKAARVALIWKEKIKKTSKNRHAKMDRGKTMKIQPHPKKLQSAK